MLPSDIDVIIVQVIDIYSINHLWFLFQDVECLNAANGFQVVCVFSLFKIMVSFFMIHSLIVSCCLRPHSFVYFQPMPISSSEILENTLLFWKLWVWMSQQSCSLAVQRRFSIYFLANLPDLLTVWMFLSKKIHGKLPD